MDKKIKQAGRIIAFLTREEVDFLDKLGKDALFTTGHKLSRTEIISALIDAINSLSIDGKDVKTAQDLKEKIIKKLGKEER